MADIGRRLYQAHFGRPDLATPDRVRELLRQAAAEVEDLRFSLRFLWTEWSRVVDAWQLASWEQYRDVPRLGRRTRLPERQRELLWSVFSKVAAALDEHRLLTEPRLFGRLERQLAKMAHPLFEFCVVDEAQDIGVAELRLLAAVGARRPDALFFAGDLGQRIFQTPFSWRALGVDIRARSHTLRVNSDPAAGRPAAAARDLGRGLQPDRAPVVLEPSSQDYPRARPRRTRSAACTGAPPAAPNGADQREPAAASSRSCRGCVSDAAASRIRPGPVRAPLSGRRPATAAPAGAPPKARMAVGRPLAVPAVKEEIVLYAFGEVLSAVYRADFIVLLWWESWEFRL